MVYAAVLAGGSGLRMGGSLPKQFLPVGGRPVLLRSIDAFLDSGSVDKIYVAVSEDYLAYTRALVEQYYTAGEPIEIVAGGQNRNETLYRVLQKIEQSGVGIHDIIVTHDAVRPFLDQRIIEENIRAARQYGACNTVVPATDTMLKSGDGQWIDSIPPRNEIFHGQTPQSFRVRKLLSFYQKMSREDFERYTDACTVFVENGEKVFLVRGDRNNIKLTYPEDMARAEMIIKGRK